MTLLPYFCSRRVKARWVVVTYVSSPAIASLAEDAREGGEVSFKVKRICSADAPFAAFAPGFGMMAK